MSVCVHVCLCTCACALTLIFKIMEVRMHAPTVHILKDSLKYTLIAED